MTRAEIQAFLAVVECGSISRAADKLFVRQSTLSGRIQNLETELNLILFKRGKGVRSSELTDHGRDFIPIAEKWEKLWQETLTAANKKQHRLLCTSAIHSVNTYIMTEACSLFAAQYPEVRLRLLIRHSDEAYHLIENGGVEAAFITKPQFSKKVEAISLFSEKTVLVYNESYPIAQTVHPSELDPGKEILLDWYREYIQWHEYWFGENSAPKVFTDDMSIMEKFLQTESCWSITPISVAGMLQRNSLVRIISLEEPPPDRNVYMIKFNKASMSEELGLLLENIREVVERQGAEWIYHKI